MNCLLLLLVALLTLGASARAQVAGADYVIVIGCDGLSPDGVRKANAPRLKQMMREGAWTLRARGVMPTSSSPNWASMIMGAGPEQHGVTSNDWQVNKYEIEPTSRGSGPMFPTIFGLLREQRPAVKMAVFHDWDDYGRLFERVAVDFIEDSIGPTNAARHAIGHIKTAKPAFTFIHFDHVDHVGHEVGHGTPEYYASVDVADQLIGEVLDGLKEAGLAERAVVLVTSDHGGVKKGHGAATMAEIEIPWILTGPGVRRGHEITAPVNTYDTALTIAHVFGLRPHSAWIGQPVTEAFSK